MRLAICSDLHLEYYDIVLTNTDNADVLVLSGDIMLAAQLYVKHTEKPFTKRFKDFLKRCSTEFKNVVYVAGNHEFYDFRWNKTLEVLRQECQSYGNINFLEDSAVMIDDYTFIGSTLWTDLGRNNPIIVHSIQNIMTDYSLIVNERFGYRKLHPRDTSIRHADSVSYIKQILENFPNNKYVICGHHAPSTASIDEMYRHDYIQNAAYVSDLSEFILDHPQIKLWTHGHVHTAFDYLIGDTRIVCNPRGYYGYEQIASTFNLKYVDLE